MSASTSSVLIAGRLYKMEDKIHYVTMSTLLLNTIGEQVPPMLARGLGQLGYARANIINLDLSLVHGHDHC